MLLAGEIRERDHFPQLLKKYNLLRHCVEIGTHRGDFAVTLLNGTLIRKLTCIDPWVKGYDDKDPASQGNREEDYLQASNVLTPFGDRVEIVRDYSDNAYDRFKNDSLDFIYIDGCHLYEQVYKDINNYWWKLRSGGIMAGHDIICPGVEEGGGYAEDIQEAVLSFVEGEEVDLYLVPETTSRFWSFYFFKP